MCAILAATSLQWQSHLLSLRLAGSVACILPLVMALPMGHVTPVEATSLGRGPTRDLLQNPERSITTQARYEACIGAQPPPSFLTRWHDSRTTPAAAGTFPAGTPITHALARARARVAVCLDQALDDPVSPTATLELKFTQRGVVFAMRSHMFISATENTFVRDTRQNNFNFGLSCFWGAPKNQARWDNANCDFLAGRARQLAMVHGTASERNRQSLVYLDANVRAPFPATAWSQVNFTNEHLWLGLSSGGIKTVMGHQRPIEPPPSFDLQATVQDEGIQIDSLQTTALDSDVLRTAPACTPADTILAQPQGAVEAGSALGACLGTFRNYNIVAADQLFFYASANLVQNCRASARNVFMGFIDREVGGVAGFTLMVTNGGLSSSIEAMLVGTGTTRASDEYQALVRFGNEPSLLLGPVVDSLNSTIISSNSGWRFTSALLKNAAMKILPTSDYYNNGAASFLYDLGPVSEEFTNATVFNNVYLSPCPATGCKDASYCRVPRPSKAIQQAQTNSLVEGLGGAARFIVAPNAKQALEQMHGQLADVNGEASWSTVSLVCITLGVGLVSAPYGRAGAFLNKHVRRYRAVAAAAVVWSLAAAFSVIPAAITYGAIDTAEEAHPVFFFTANDDDPESFIWKGRTEFVHALEAQASIVDPAAKKAMLVIAATLSSLGVTCMGIYKAAKPDP